MKKGKKSTVTERKQASKKPRDNTYTAAEVDQKIAEALGKALLSPAPVDREPPPSIEVTADDDKLLHSIISRIDGNLYSVHHGISRIDCAIDRLQMDGKDGEDKAASAKPTTIHEKLLRLLDLSGGAQYRAHLAADRLDKMV